MTALAVSCLVFLWIGASYADRCAANARYSAGLAHSRARRTVKRN